MNIIEKIQASIFNATGLQTYYDSAKRLNYTLDNAEFPCVFLHLLTQSNVQNNAGMLCERITINAYFVNTTEFDFESYSNEDIIAICKATAMQWVNALKTDSELKIVSLAQMGRSYDQMAVNITGFVLGIVLEEINGQICDVPVNPDKLATQAYVDAKVLAEQLARIEADENLQSLIDTLSQNVVDLSEEIAQEAIDRESADTTLQGNIDNEADIRSTADASLSNAIALKVDKIIDYSLVSNAEILKIHSRNTDSTLLSENGQHNVYIDNSGVFHVKDISQVGTLYVTHAEQIYTTKNEIILRDGAVAGLGVGEVTGLRAKLYDGVNDGHFVFDRDGWARVGDVGSLQKLATIEETTTDGWLMKYNAAKLRLEGLNPLLLPISTAMQNALDLKQNALGFTPVNKAGDTMNGTLVGTTFKLNKLVPNSDTTGIVLRNAADSADVVTIDTTNTQLLIGASSVPNSLPAKLYVKGTGSSSGTWRGRIIAGGDNVAFLMGEYSSQAWLGAHNAALNAWADFYINPDGGRKVVVGSNNLAIFNNNGTISLNAQLTINGAIISYGANDSAGTGYRIVRVPNA